jgi:kynurenine formamidase
MNARNPPMGWLVDLSHTIHHGMITYKSLPGPVICDFLSREASRARYEEGTEFQIARIDMVANTGTYIDVPSHRYENGKDLSQSDLEWFANIPGVVVRVPHETRLAVQERDFAGVEVEGKAALVHTGWNRRWGTSAYFSDHPFLTAGTASFLRDRGARLVGIDSHNIDDTRTRARPVHSILLAADIPIVEHLCELDQWPDRGFRFNAVPPKVRGMGTFPVRAFAEIAGE